MTHADYVFVSKEAAGSMGFSDAVTAVEGIVTYCRQGSVGFNVACPANKYMYG